ncbi:MAG: hypothetical protein ACTSVV_12830 [Promethearchaeota archaeon]
MSDNNYNDILDEIRMIKNLIILINNEQIEKYLNTIIKTDKRKIMWCFIDSKNSVKEIAKLSGASSRGVQYFLNYLSTLGLIIYQRNEPPRKILNFTPSDWLKLISDIKTIDNEEKINGKGEK